MAESAGRPGIAKPARNPPQYSATAREIASVHRGGIGQPLDSLPGASQRGCCLVGVADHLAQAYQRLAEVAQRGRIGLLGPEQGRKRGTSVRPIGFGCQVGQQGAHLVAVEARDRHAVALNLERPKKGQCT